MPRRPAARLHCPRPAGDPRGRVSHEPEGKRRVQLAGLFRRGRRAIRRRPKGFARVQLPAGLEFLRAHLLAGCRCCPGRVAARRLIRQAGLLRAARRLAVRRVRRRPWRHPRHLVQRSRVRPPALVRRAFPVPGCCRRPGRRQQVDRIHQRRAGVMLRAFRTRRRCVARRTAVVDHRRRPRTRAAVGYAARRRTQQADRRPRRRSRFLPGHREQGRASRIESLLQPARQTGLEVGTAR